MLVHFGLVRPDREYTYEGNEKKLLEPHIKNIRALTIQIEDVLECLGANARNFWQAMDLNKNLALRNCAQAFEHHCEHLLSDTVELTSLPRFEVRLAMKYLVRGDKEKFKHCLQKDRNLVLSRGQIKDYDYKILVNTSFRGVLTHANYKEISSLKPRYFNNITMLQYGLLISNKAVCKTIVSYMSLEEVAHQLQALEKGDVEIIVNGKRDNALCAEWFEKCKKTAWFSEIKTGLPDDGYQPVQKNKFC